jgi:hypothetical protein
LAGGKDGQGNLPGLITAAERAMLRGGSENGNSLADLYTKVGYINNGLRINNQPIKFYSDANNPTTSTPINLIGAED